MKLKTLAIILSVALILYFGMRYAYYGSITEDCNYTEKRLPAPKQLAEGKIVVAKDAYIAIGQDPEYTCLDNLGKIDRKIVGPEAISNTTIGKDYFINRGLSIEPLKKGSSFNLIDVIAVTKHGITTVDSGPGPIYYLILKDSINALYNIATVSLGLNEEDLFLAFVDSSQTADSSSVKLLSPFDFIQPDNKEETDTFIYKSE
jgi:hypothetical protein